MESRYRFNALVARKVSRAEARREKKPQAALQVEWDRLRADRAWDERKVREWADVAAEARSRNKEAHVGMVFDICVGKESVFLFAS